MVELQAYKNAVNRKFQVIDTEPLLELELIAVDDRGTAGGYEQFTLVFRGPKDRFVQQQTLVLQYPGMADEAVFVVPVSQDAEGFRYEAIFNRLAEKQ